MEDKYTKEVILILTKMRPKSGGIVALALIGTVILIFFTMLDFRNQVEGDIKQDMRASVEAIRRNLVREIDNEMAYIKALNEATANFMASQERRSDSEVDRILESYAAVSRLKCVVFVTPDRQIDACYPSAVGIKEAVVPVDGLEETEFIEPWYSKELDGVFFGVATPVNMPGHTGVLMAAYDIQGFYELFRNDFFGGASEIGLINREGMVILGRQTPDGDNEFGTYIFDLLSQDVKFSGNSADGMQKDFRSGAEGFSSYVVDNTERYCSYGPVKYKDWYIIAMAKENVLRRQTIQLQRQGTRLAAELVGIMAVLLFIIIAVWQREQKRIQIELSKAAMLDGLTGIYNRRAVEAEIVRCLGASKDNCASQDNRHAMFLMDIDFFKEINDNYGHIVGDMVLIKFAARLRELFEENDIVGRMGGDEFLVLHKNCGSEADVAARADRLTEPFLIEGVEGVEPFSIRISAGIVLCGRGGGSFMELYQQADLALYYTKKHGRDGYSFYDQIRHDAVPR